MFILEYISCVDSIWELLRGSHGQSGLNRGGGAHPNAHSWLCPRLHRSYGMLYNSNSQYLVGGFNPSEKYESDWIIIPAIGENNPNVPNHQPGMIKAEQTLSDHCSSCEKKTDLMDRRSHLGSSRTSAGCYRCLSVWDLDPNWLMLNQWESSNEPIIQNGDHVPICSHETRWFSMGFPHLLKDFWCQVEPEKPQPPYFPLTQGALVGLLADLVDLVDPTWALALALAEMREK